MTPREKIMGEIGLIALRHGLTRHDILSKDTKRIFIAARHHCYWYLRQKIVGGQPMSYTYIGRIMGRDHTTIIYGIRKHLERNKL